MYVQPRRGCRGVSRLSRSTSTSSTTIFRHFSQARVEIKNSCLSNYVGNPLSGLHQLRYDLFLKLFRGIRPFFQEVVNESTAIRLRASTTDHFVVCRRDLGSICGYAVYSYWVIFFSSELIMLEFFPLGTLRTFFADHGYIGSLF